MKKGGKNPAAVALGKLRIAAMTEDEHLEMSRKGGIAGGQNSRKRFTPAERKAMAQRAANARWKKKKR
jgi:hypothetical protein